MTEDDLPLVSVANATVTEGSIGAITVSLSQPCPTSAVTVSYTMADGTATAGDYVGLSGSFTIPAGQTSALLGVTTLEDTNPYEGDETFSLTISNPVNATLGATVTSVVTILDNDISLSSANDISSISAGPRHTCVIRAGGAYCWGTNGNGELGNGTTAPSYLPVAVTGLLGGVTKIASSGFMYSDTRTSERSCAIVSGAAKCWGYQSVGELGNNGGATSSSVPVTGLTSGVTDIDTSDAGYQGFTCAVHNGAAKCWGLNSTGQLGNNSTVDSLTPVTVSGIASGATKISVGYRHSCALVSGGVKCWGYNNYGQLGNGTVVNSSVPVDATGMTSGVVDIATGADTIGGYALACAIDSAGAVKCWGANYSGQVGDGSTTQRSVPTQVVGLTSGFTQVSVSPATACAVKSTGQAYCWGDMTSGQAGNDLGGFVYKPLDPVGMSTGITGLSTGHAHGCAIKSGALKCWGNNNTGNLGNGNTTSQSVPTSVIGMNSGVTSVSANSDVANNFRHTCAVQNGSAFCWGDNNWGQLGNGVTGGSSSVPVQVSGLTSGVLSISASMLHTCAVMISGGVKCWGDNTYGQLGNNSTTLSNVPVDVTGVTAATEIVVTSRHSCAIDAGGMKCWGYNNFGQLGDGTTNTRLIPVIPTGMSSGVTSIAAQGANGSSEVTCAVVNGSAKCWGAGYYGALGTGTSSDQHAPAQVAGYASGVKKITAFSSGGCLLTTGNSVACWGTNNYMVVAPTLSVSTAYSPLALGFAPAGVADISGGGYGMCLITTSQSLKCWGYLAQAGAGYLFHYFSSPVEVLFHPPSA